MTDDWNRVGQYVKSRRKELGLRQEDLQGRGGPSPALVRQLENGRYDADMQDAMRSGLERSLEWAAGSLTSISAGGEPMPEPSNTVAPPSSPDLDRQLGESLAAFQQAVAKLVAAESDLDLTMRRWALSEWGPNKLHHLVMDEEAALGRALTKSERDELAGQVGRPTPFEMAELLAEIALNDTREWTRYEMALIEVIVPEFPQDVRKGSSYADLEPFRERVQRLGRGNLSVVDDTLPAAAKDDGLEESGENSI